ncbi:MAG: hypothetical protein C0597_10505 [Marinilabiliales bacterium]|nr:MAG: hypothetical protein C0597_10505 [Marinilabiliales bacterium]
MMILNYFKIALRNIFKDKYNALLYFLILTIGISSFSVMVMVVDHELGFDKFHKDADSIYRITTYFKRENGREVKWAITNGYLPTLLKEQIPEVESAIKFLVVQSELSINIDDKSFILPERSGYFADSSFFSVLDFPLLYRDKDEVLSKPNIIVISEDLAIKLFAKLDVVGEKIEWDFGNEKRDLIVSGVMKNIPHNSHLQFDFLISGTSYGEYWDQLEDPQSRSWSCHVYFKVKPGTNYIQLKEKIKKEVFGVYGERMQYPIQRFTDIYYNANNLFEETSGGNMLYVKILLSLSILILFIVAINYSILTASKSLKRYHEIGIRKTLGSNHRKIGLRFIVEASFFSFICGIISLGITEILFQFIISRFIYEANLSLFGNTKLIAIILLSSVLLCVLSGIYTATGSLNKSVINILKGKYKTQQDRQFSLRNILVIFQFVITGSLIAGNVIILKQLRYIESKDLGYNKEYVINISRPSNVSNGQFKAFAEELRKETCVIGVGATLYKFISDYNATSISVVNEKGDTVSTRVQWNSIDEGLIPTLNMQLIDGRNFSGEIRTDSFAAIVNEAAVKNLNLKDPVGKRILNSYLFGNQGKLIGVVKNFHFQ